MIALNLDNAAIFDGSPTAAGFFKLLAQRI